MIDLNPENVYFLIDKLREFHAKEAVSIPEVPTSPADDWAQQVLADHLDDASFAEVSAVVEDLEPDQQVTLVALMWLGRGDYSLDEWDQALSDAADGYNGRTAQYLASTPLVAEYLEEGLDAHGYSDDEG